MRTIAAVALALAFSGCGMNGEGQIDCDPDLFWSFEVLNAASPTPHLHAVWSHAEVASHEDGRISWTAEMPEGAPVALEIAADGTFPEQEIYLVKGNGFGARGLASGTCARSTYETDHHGPQPFYECELTGSFDGEALPVVLELASLEELCPVP